MQETFKGLWCELYATIVRNPSDADIWQRLARGLATVFELPLVVIGEYGAAGTLKALAASHESALWRDLHRVPERWDGTVAGRGLAAIALEGDGVATLDLDDERFACWRDGAVRDHLRRGCAVQIRSTLGQYLLQMFSPDAAAFEGASLARLVDTARQLRALLDDLALLREQRLLSRALDEAGNAAFITDRDGTIVWCNHAFSRMYGYGRDEAVGQNPRFLKSGRQGVRYYRELWSTIRAGRVWAGETVDRDRNGTAYTVKQTITPFACDGDISHFLAIHDDISAEYAQRQRRQLREGMDANGLMTRAAFEERMTRATGDRARRWSLVLVSLREFQEGVHALGNQIAEQVAAELASRLRTLFGTDAAIAALSAGEYAVLLCEDNGAADANGVARDINDALGKPFPALSPTLIAKARVAIARFPDQGAGYDELMHAADRQLADRPVARARL